MKNRIEVISEDDKVYIDPDKIDMIEIKRSSGPVIHLGNTEIVFKKEMEEELLAKLGDRLTLISAGDDSGLSGE